MALFEWKDSYSIGVAEIDQQHRNLMELINRLDQMSQTEAPPRELAQVFAELSEYICSHFRREEKLMTSIDYPEGAYVAHVKLHRQFEEEIEKLEQDSKGLSGEDYNVVLSYLTHWFIRHICKVDQKLGNYVISKRLHKDHSADEGEDSKGREDERVRHSILAFSSKVLEHVDRADHHLGLLVKEQKIYAKIMQGAHSRLPEGGQEISTIDSDGGRADQEIELLLEELQRALSSIRKEFDALELHQSKPKQPK